MTKNFIFMFLSITLLVGAVMLGAFKLGERSEGKVTEVRISESRDRSMRLAFCTQICRSQEQPLMGITEKPEWRCFCKAGYWQPLP